jgi:hypothetical protein
MNIRAYLFNELYIIILLLHSFYTSTYMANMAYLSFERHRCTKKKEKKKERKKERCCWYISKMQTKLDYDIVDVGQILESCENAPWENFQRNFLIIVWR